jgi:hypothetical protein
MNSKEEHTLFHMIKARKRREARRIGQIQDQQDKITEDPTEIIQIFVAHMKRKYGTIEVKDNCVAEMARVIRPISRTDHAESLERPITSEELYAALKARGRNKSPGSDSINREFYVSLWDAIRY